MSWSNFWARYFKTTKISFPLLNYSIKTNQYQEIFKYCSLNKSFHFLTVHAGAMWWHVMDKLIMIQLIEKKNLNLFLLEKIIGSWKYLSLISTICHFSSVYPTRLRILRIISTEWGVDSCIVHKISWNVLLSWNLVAIKFHLECFWKRTLCFPPAHFIGDVSISFLEISDLTRSYNFSS